MTKYIDPLGRYTDNEELQRQSRENMKKMVEKKRKEYADTQDLWGKGIKKMVEYDQQKLETELAREKFKKAKELDEEYEKRGLKTERTRRLEDAWRNMSKTLREAYDD